jgi:DNA mismatch endonuclease (patch repair protein)
LIKNKDTGPELRIRKLVFNMGYRYRLHGSSLPGRPDLVFKSKRKVIFVHGCFWHRHNCKMGRLPKTKIDYWLLKLEKNRLRDLSNLEKIKQLGWTSLVIWECELKHSNLEGRIKKFLDK